MGFGGEFWPQKREKFTLKKGRTRDCPHTGLPPNGIFLLMGLPSQGTAPTRDCPHIGLPTNTISPNQDCPDPGFPYPGLSPNEIAPKMDWTHTVLPPPGFAHNWDYPAWDCLHPRFPPPRIAPTKDYPEPRLCLHGIFPTWDYPHLGLLPYKMGPTSSICNSPYLTLSSTGGGYNSPRNVFSLISPSFRHFVGPNVFDFS